MALVVVFINRNARIVRIITVMRRQANAVRSATLATYSTLMEHACKNKTARLTAKPVII